MNKNNENNITMQWKELKELPIAVYNNVLATDVTPNPVRGGGPVEPVWLRRLLCEGSRVLLAMHGEDPQKPEETAAFRRACNALGLDYLVIPSAPEKGLDYSAYTNDSELAQIVGDEILATDEKEYAAHIDMYDKWGKLYTQGVGKWLYNRLERHIPAARFYAEPVMSVDGLEAFRPLVEAGLMELSDGAKGFYEQKLRDLDQDMEAWGLNDEEKAERREHLLKELAENKGKVMRCEITDAGFAQGLFWGTDRGNMVVLFCTAEAYPRIMKLLPEGRVP